MESAEKKPKRTFLEARDDCGLKEKHQPFAPLREEKSHAGGAKGLGQVCP
jgi:hypothetical protein